MASQTLVNWHYLQETLQTPTAVRFGQSHSYPLNYFRLMHLISLLVNIRQAISKKMMQLDCKQILKRLITSHLYSDSNTGFQCTHLLLLIISEYWAKVHLWTARWWTTPWTAKVIRAWPSRTRTHNCAIKHCLKWISKFIQWMGIMAWMIADHIGAPGLQLPPHGLLGLYKRWAPSAFQCVPHTMELAAGHPGQLLITFPNGDVGAFLRTWSESKIFVFAWLSIHFLFWGVKHKRHTQRRA